MLSVIIPVYNEQDNIVLVADRVVQSLERIGQPFEVLFINDGSTDASETRLAEVASGDTRIKVINFRRNFGQTAAMMAGIDYAQGDVLIPLDGDVQNDPDDIPKLLAKLDEGYDVVSGWRKDRQDNPLSRNLPSRIANRLISRISGLSLNDYGCSLKAYRRDVLKGVKLYGEMHRFVPIYASWQGARVAEVPVRHYKRQHGKSKYGLERTLKVILDLIVVKFFSQFFTKPIYLFGGFGLLSLGLSGLVASYAVYLKVAHDIHFVRTPLPLLVTMTFLSGMMSILSGLLAELTVRTYYESQGKSIYLVKQTLNVDAPTGTDTLPLKTAA